MEHFGKIVILVGVVFVLAGGVLLLFGKLGIGFGRLPGDIRFDAGENAFRFPVVSCLIVSVVLTVILNIVLRWWR